jgi:hypothetical protein
MACQARGRKVRIIHHQVGQYPPSFVRQLLLPLVLSGRIEGFLGRDE